MGRSLAPISAGPDVGVDRKEGSIAFDVGRSRFTIEHHGERRVHREAVLDEKGLPLAQVEAEVK